MNIDPEKEALLQQMMDFQIRRTKQGKLTLNLIKEGLVLFNRLAEICDTPQLRQVCTTYHKHLNCEYKAMIKGRFTVIDGGLSKKEAL